MRRARPDPIDRAAPIRWAYGGPIAGVPDGSTERARSGRQDARIQRAVAPGRHPDGPGHGWHPGPYQ
jgi:hypothetical protein